MRLTLNKNDVETPVKTAHKSENVPQSIQWCAIPDFDTN